MAMDGSDTLPLKTSFLLKKGLNEGLMLYLHKPLLVGGSVCELVYKPEARVE